VREREKKKKKKRVERERERARRRRLPTRNNDREKLTFTISHSSSEMTTGGAFDDDDDEEEEDAFFLVSANPSLTFFPGEELKVEETAPVTRTPSIIRTGNVMLGTRRRKIREACTILLVLCA